MRLKEYDYSQPGEYFVTICTHKHECVLGEIIDGKMQLNEIGRIVHEEWLQTPIIRPEAQLDSYVVMPNHIHGIIVLNDCGNTLQPNKPVGANCYSPQKKQQNNCRAYIDTPLQNKFQSPSNTIGAIIRGFKSVTTKRINELHVTPKLQFWQRGYYDRIIRNDSELNIIRDYIQNNVLNWAFEKENPDSIPLR